jgi:hypothetical protein
MSLFNKKTAAGARPGARGRYGIAEAMQLMRTLPVDQNVELVVRVIRSTLESMNVQLPGIIEDAEARETSLQARMGLLNEEIASFSREIERRRQEIATLEAELVEITTVKERLRLAQSLAVPPPAAPRPTSLSLTPPPLPARVPPKAPAELR